MVIGKNLPENGFTLPIGAVRQLGMLSIWS